MKLYRAARVLTYLFIGAIVVMLVPPLRNNLIPVWPHAWRQLSTLQVRVLDSILFCFVFLRGLVAGAGGPRCRSESLIL